MADSEGVPCVVLSKFGGYDGIVYTKRSRPTSAKGHVRVAVKACGVNFSDVFTWQGIHTTDNRQPPFIMGLECSGIVEEKADDVDGLEVGDRVVCCNFQYGMWSEEICIPATNCVKIPDCMTYEDAASFLINYLTAYLAVTEIGNLREGQTLYLESAGGGVGCAATQIGKSVKDVTIVGSASPAKHEMLLRNGLDRCFDSRSEDSFKEFRKEYPAGVDVIVSTTAGADIRKNMQLLKPLGRLILIGAANAITGERKSILQILKIMWQTKGLAPLDLINSNHSACGLNILKLWETDNERFWCSVGLLLTMYQNGILKPVIDSVWPFSQVTKAIARLVERKNVGKVILVPKEDMATSVPEEDLSICRLQTVPTFAKEEGATDSTEN